MRIGVREMTALVLALAGGAVVAQEASAPVSTVHETSAEGALPDLTGRWLVLADLALQERNRTVPAFWVVRDQPEGWALSEHFVDLPPSLAEALETRRQAQELWEPTADELTALRDAWDELPDQKRGVVHARHEFWGRDAFTDEHTAEEKKKDAQWILRQTYQFEPGGNRPIRQVSVLGAFEETPGGGWAGNYSAVVVAAAPFPVPIPYQGTFRMLRLDAKPARGLLQRIGDLFAGCGR